MKARVPFGPGKRRLLLLLGILCCFDIGHPSWFFRDAWLGAFAVAFVPKTTHSGGIPTTPRTATNTAEDAVETGSQSLDNNDLETVQVLTKRAIFECGTPPGYSALSALHDLCQRRLSYDFDSATDDDKDGDDPSNDSKDDSTQQDPGEGIISKLSKLLPDATTQKFLQAVRTLEDQGYMSTNPDSVDGLPSLHLNLVSNGKPLYTSGDGDDDKGESGDETGVSFERQIHKLYELVRPFVYDQLLPEADRLLQSQAATTSKPKRKLRVSDVFLRRYGQDICGSVTRQGISIHYDVYSRITAVVALDEVAAQGTNGLFTLQLNKHGKTSNHKALRRFFPLHKGDCVLHTWDVLHGVDVEAGLDRTSLIVWFDEVQDDDNEDQEEATPMVSPWLSLEHQEEDETRTTLSDGNDVRQFVLASALSSTPQQEDAVANALYLASASQGNAFALTRMGSICEEGPIPQELKQQAFAMLEKLRPLPELPEILGDLLASLYHQDGIDQDVAERTELACRFWLEASLWGNPLAQKSLADEVMFVASQSGNPLQRVLAATLFALASQQDAEQDDGSSQPSDSLSRAIEYDVAAREVSSQEEFLASPVVQTARAAHGGL